jgi:hypothetical protein
VKRHALKHTNGQFKVHVLPSYQYALREHILKSVRLSQFKVHELPSYQYAQKRTQAVAVALQAFQTVGQHHQHHIIRDEMQ